MKQMSKKNRSGSVLILLVFAVFAVSVMMILLTGADAVGKLNKRDQESYDQRTLLQYITTRVRQADQCGMVTVRDFGDTDALVLGQEIDGSYYETLVYCHEGYLRELFTEADAEMDAEFGEIILPVRNVCFYDETTHIRAELTLSNGQKECILLMMRSERGQNNEK